MNRGSHGEEHGGQTGALEAGWACPERLACSLPTTKESEAISTMESLTRRQTELLQQIADCWRRGQQPTTGELVEAMGLARESSLTTLLEPLREKGFIDVVGGVRGRQRRIELTQSGRIRTGMGLPILGAIPAGPLQEAVQQTDEWLGSAGEILRTQPGDFLLRVQGDSMVGACILPGDLVLLRPAVQWRSGEIAAVQISDGASGIMEATLKYLDLLPDSPNVRLRAANPIYADREVPAESVSVAGVYRGLIRNI